jgi:single-strand DNA-binding protein
MAQIFGLARLGKDAVIRHTSGGDAVVGLALAFTYGAKGGDGKRPTQWVEGSFWGKRAEALAPYLLKGGMVSITLDDVHIETYQGSNGEAHKLTGKVSQIELAGGGQTAAPAAQPKPASQPAPRAAPKKDFVADPDDIPF